MWHVFIVGKRVDTKRIPYALVVKQLPVPFIIEELNEVIGSLVYSKMMVSHKRV